MRHQRALLLATGVLIAALGTPAVVQADQVAVSNPEQSAGPSLPPATLTSAFLANFELADRQQADALDRQLWAQNLVQAKERQRRSTWFLIGGAGAIGLGLMTQAKERNTGLTYITDTGVGTATMLYLIGGGLGVYGYMERTRSLRDIAALESEGRRRGFMAFVGPTRAGIAYALMF